MRKDRKSTEAMLDALGASAHGLHNTLQANGSVDDSIAASFGRIRARYIELSGDPGLIGKAKADLPAAGGLALVPSVSCRPRLSQKLSTLSRGRAP